MTTIPKNKILDFLYSNDRHVSLKNLGSQYLYSNSVNNPEQSLITRSFYEREFLLNQFLMY